MGKFQKLQRPFENNLVRKSFKISQILKKLNIEDFILIGNSKREFSFPGTIWDAERRGIAYCISRKVDNLIKTINQSKASVVITEKEVDQKKLDSTNKTIILVEDPRAVFIKILDMCFSPSINRGTIEKSAIIDPCAEIHRTVSIGSNCVIGKCQIGENSIIYPNVTLNDNVTLGKNVLVNPGSVIGYDGISYARNEKGELDKFLQYGGVVIEDDVEIGCNVCIDRGTFGNTVVKKGSKIGHVCYIGHNTVVGENCAITGFNMIGGSTVIGDCSWIAIGAVLRDGIKLGKKVFVGLGAVVTKDIPDNTVVAGNPARPFDEFKRIQGMMKDLSDGKKK